MATSKPKRFRGLDHFIAFLGRKAVRTGFFVNKAGEIRYLDKEHLHGCDHPYPTCPLLRAYSRWAAVPVSRMLSANSFAASYGTAMGLTEAMSVRVMTAADFTAATMPKDTGTGWPRGRLLALRRRLLKAIKLKEEAA